jgi:hypothetical protein
LQFQNGNVNTGYLQLINNDLKIGTNAANDGGQVILRTNGTDKLTVDKFGQVTVGDGVIGSITIKANNPSFSLRRDNQSLMYISADDIGNKDVVLSRYTQGGGNGKLILNNSTKSIYLSEDGHTNIGSGEKPTGYRLSVAGKVISTEFTALAIASWPDYVFADEYKLKPLADVKKFIAENKHLPNIPSAKEIEKNGIELGDMSKRLMEKVEELTLYLIQLDEKNIQLQKQIDELKNSNQK